MEKKKKEKVNHQDITISHKFIIPTTSHSYGAIILMPHIITLHQKDTHYSNLDINRERRKKIDSY